MGKERSGTQKGSLGLRLFMSCSAGRKRERRQLSQAVKVMAVSRPQQRERKLLEVSISVSEAPTYRKRAAFPWKVTLIHLLVAGGA
jgi:hypothetical protein